MLRSCSSRFIRTLRIPGVNLKAATELPLRTTQNPAFDSSGTHLQRGTEDWHGGRTDVRAGHQFAILVLNTLVVPIAVVRVWDPDVGRGTGDTIAVDRDRGWCRPLCCGVCDNRSDGIISGGGSGIAIAVSDSISEGGKRVT